MIKTSSWDSVVKYYIMKIKGSIIYQQTWYRMECVKSPITSNLETQHTPTYNILRIVIENNLQNWSVCLRSPLNDIIIYLTVSIQSIPLTSKTHSHMRGNKFYRLIRH